MPILQSLRRDRPPPCARESVLGGSDWRPNAQTLAQAFECSAKTIQRDLESLRLIGYEIEYDEQSYQLVWVNREGLEPLPLMAANEEEILALLTSLAISSSVLDAAAARHLDSFLDKLERQLPDGYLHPLQTVASTLNYRPSPPQPGPPRSGTFVVGAGCSTGDPALKMARIAN